MGNGIEEKNMRLFEVVKFLEKGTTLSLVYGLSVNLSDT